jgi:hypothetical protein
MEIIYGRIFFALAVIASFCHFTLIKEKLEDWGIAYYIEHELPPGVIYLGENLFYDQTEITNQHWCEFTYWTQIRFGLSSEEYLATLPDTLC